MKQLKFLKTVSLESRPIWYKDCCYEVVSEGNNKLGQDFYKVFCEDLQLRGIDKNLAGSFYTIIEIADKKEEPKVETVKEEKKEIKVAEKSEEIKPKTNTQKSKYNGNKKKKYTK